MMRLLLVLGVCQGLLQPPLSLRTTDLRRWSATTSSPENEVVVLSSDEEEVAPAAPEEAPVLDDSPLKKEKAPASPLAVERGSLVFKKFKDRKTSIWFPKLELPRPELLDGTHAGDRGFDPLGFVKTKNDLFNMMEAEVRHCRLAMLCAAGWPLSELNPAFDGFLLADGGRAPSILNGHFFDSPTFLFVALFFAELGRREILNIRVPKRSQMYGHLHTLDLKAIEDEWPYGVAGDENFDPLGLYGLFGKDAVGRFVLRDLELAHGRIAMLAVLGYVLLEATTQQPVVELTPFLFGRLF